jgi:hypothetical protein
MTEFQLGLLIIGALAVAGVLVYNRVQERGARRGAERFSGSRHPDVLLDSATRRREPTLDSEDLASPRVPGARDEVVLDGRLDYIIELVAPGSNVVAAALELWEPIARRHGSRVTLLAADDKGSWHRAAAAAGPDPSKLRAALQLVNRTGIVSEAELIEFRSQVETLAAKIGASVSAPEMRQAIDGARELDQVCADADIQVALHLVAPADKPFERATLRLATRDLGLEPEEGHRFALRDGQGRVLYVIGERDGGDPKEGTIGALTLLLDVPRVPEVGKVYESMVRCAGHLATLLGGEIVDDNGRALDERALTAIEAELVRISRALESRGIAPGGATALRLFS